MLNEKGKCHNKPTWELGSKLRSGKGHNNTIT